MSINKKQDFKKRNKILVVCGPTATGKTSLALLLAKKFRGELISADSRQIYKEMDIGTGKDLPESSKTQISNEKLRSRNEMIEYYKINGTRVWGYDLIDAKSEFSVSQYIAQAKKILKIILKNGKLPIIVGGSGLYIKGLVNGIPSAFVPKNLNLRKSHSGKNAEELFEILCSLDPIKSASLNVSDRKNPRRLIRAIEIADFKLRRGFSYKKEMEKRFIADFLFVGLTAPKKVLNEKIEKRVYERLNIGFEKEVLRLLKMGVKFSHQSMQALGYRNWEKVISRKSTKKEATKEWIRDERKYAKRQMTWFKKDKRVIWFDINKKGLNKEVEKVVRKWHNEDISS